MHSPAVPPCTRLPVVGSLSPHSCGFHDCHVWENVPLDRGKSASPIFCFCYVTWVSACLLARFYKIPAVPAGKPIGLTALSGGNSQKRTHFRMIQILFTSSSKQLFTNRRKCVYSVFPTEIDRKKCWWNGCLACRTCSPLPKGATVTRGMAGERLLGSLVHLSASAPAEVKVAELRHNSSWWNSVFSVYGRFCHVFCDCFYLKYLLKHIIAPKTKSVKVAPALQFKPTW